MRAIIITGLLLSSSALSATAYAALPAIQGSLFDRLGVARPDTPVSQILPQRRLPVSEASLQIASASPADSPTFAAPAATLPDASPSPLAPQVAPVAANPVLTAKLETPPKDAMSSAPESSAAKSPAAQTADAAEPAAKTSPWSDILSRYGKADGDLNRFDYGGLAQNAADMSALDSYIQKLAGMKPSSMGRNEALAYWANLYNAVTVQVVAKNWPVKSIRDIKSGTFKPGPWDLDLVTVEGRAMTLNDIEHGTMRANYKEPRIHYMVNCASIGCPNLMLRPWKADTLEADMNAAAKAFINSPRGAEVSGGKLTVSSIFKWYKEDFGDNDAGVIAHLKQYANADLKSSLDGIRKVSKDQYDWTVNAK